MAPPPPASEDVSRSGQPSMRHTETIALIHPRTHQVYTLARAGEHQYELVLTDEAIEDLRTLPHSCLFSITRQACTLSCCAYLCPSSIFGLAFALIWCRSFLLSNRIRTGAVHLPFLLFCWLVCQAPQATALPWSSGEPSARECAHWLLGAVAGSFMIAIRHGVILLTHVCSVHLLNCAIRILSRQEVSCDSLDDSDMEMLHLVLRCRGYAALEEQCPWEVGNAMGLMASILRMCLQVSII